MWPAGPRPAGVPLVALVGQIGQGFEPMYDLGLSAVFSINRAAQPLAESAPHAAENLRLAAENVLRLWQGGTAGIAGSGKPGGAPPGFSVCAGGRRRGPGSKFPLDRRDFFLYTEVSFT